MIFEIMVALWTNPVAQHVSRSRSLFRLDPQFKAVGKLPLCAPRNGSTN